MQHSTVDLGFHCMFSSHASFMFVSASLSSGFPLMLKAGMWLQSQGHLEASQSLPSAKLCSASVSVKFCTCDVQDVNTIDEAVQQLRDKCCIQPVLFSFQDRHWIKLDNTAVPVNASCVADAFELLVQYFFACNVAFPTELWLVYGFVERLLGIRPSVGKSITLAEFCKHVLANN